MGIVMRAAGFRIERKWLRLRNGARSILWKPATIRPFATVDEAVDYGIAMKLRCPMTLRIVAMGTGNVVGLIGGSFAGPDPADLDGHDNASEGATG